MRLREVTTRATTSDRRNPNHTVKSTSGGTFGFRRFFLGGRWVGGMARKSIAARRLDGLKAAFAYGETNRLTEFSPEANAAD